MNRKMYEKFKKLSATVMKYITNVNKILLILVSIWFNSDKKKKIYLRLEYKM